MQCVVTGGNVKVLAKAIHSLSRIGDELYVEPQEDGVSCFDAVRNTSTSSYHHVYIFAYFLFASTNGADLNASLSCTIKVDSQSVFRSLATLEKTVEKCHIELNEQKDRLTFTLHCKHGLLKTHNLSYQDSESLQAVFNKDTCTNEFRAQPRVLVDTVAHFPPSLEEVTVTVSDERMWVRNHVEDETGNTTRSKAMLTELCLASDEFDHFVVKTPNSVTFCLKEFRGLLVFAESSNLPVSMYFDEPGSPVVLSVTDGVLEGNFVLATLSDDPITSLFFLFPFWTFWSTLRAHAPPSPPPDDFMNDDMDSYLIAMDTSVASGPSTAGPSASTLTDPCTSKLPEANHRTRTHSEEEEEEMEDGSERPPNKKFRSLFFGSVFPPSPKMSTQPVTTQEVLASDSEDES
uniref:Cell cycle checkpoint control protein n=1 Tax=Oryzias sinensis TaxID=183150 RepID=A0A8C7YJS8_9TELE